MINLNIDCQKEVQKIENNLRKTLSSFKRNGLVVGVSGGVDSAVTACLAVNALGKENVILVTLPEKESDPKSLQRAKKLSSMLDMDLIENDITPMIESFGVYQGINNIVKKYFPVFDSSFRYKLTLPQDLLNKKQLNIYSLVILDSGENEVFKKRLSSEDYRVFRSFLSIKLRVRMIMLYNHAERNNLLVAGTTNRSEFELGNFCKYGDGGVDIEILSHLYKGQVYDLARFLGVPDEIINCTPSPGIFSATVSDSEFFFSLPFELLDKLLYAEGNGVPIEKAADFMNLEPDQVARIYQDFKLKKSNNDHLKHPPIGIQEVEYAFQ